MIKDTVSHEAELCVVHVTASQFFGGPERQMLELAKSLRPEVESVYASFEGDASRPFLDQVQQAGFCTVTLKHDTPHLVAAWRELVGLLRDFDADILCCHGYKANLLGLIAARRVRTAVLAVSRGWTGETGRVRLYEALDRRLLRWMDRVVCVSEAQQEKVRRARVPQHKSTVIHNAIRIERFADPVEDARLELQRLFPDPPAKIVGAAGRLSAEKGFDVLIDAAEEVVRDDASVGFVLFGEGRLQDELAARIEEKGLDRTFVLAGFRPNLDHYFSHFDLFVLPSHTEGLSNVALESSAAGVPIVATDVGGNPEVVADGVTGYLVPAGDSTAMARRILDVLTDENRHKMGSAGRQRIIERFSFAAQAAAYRQLFEELVGGNHACR